MGRRLRIVASISGGLVLLALCLIAGLAIFLRNYDVNTIKPLLQQAVSAATGRQLVIDGDLESGLSLHPRLVVHGLHLTNVAGGSRAAMMNLRRLDIQLALLPLLRGHLQVDRIDLFEPDILFETLAGGGNNWSFATHRSGRETSQHTTQLLVPSRIHIRIHNAHVHYHDDGKQLGMRFPHLELRQDAPDAPMTWQGTGILNGRRFSIDGSTETLASLLDNRPVRVVLNVRSGEASLQLAGRIGRPLSGRELALKLEFKARFVTPSNTRSQTVTLATHLRDDNHAMVFENIRASITNNKLTGRLRIIAGKRLLIRGKLSADMPDLARLLPQQTQATQRKHLFSSQALELSVLRVIDTDLSVHIKRMGLPRLMLGDVQISPRLNDGRLNMSFSATVAGGHINGWLRLDSRHRPASWKLNLKAASIHPAVLLSTRKDTSALIDGAPIDGSFRIEGEGNSAAAIMAHANGELLLKIGRGHLRSETLELLGSDMLVSLAERLNPFSEAVDNTQLLCGVIHFHIKSGKATTDNGIAFETKRMNIISSGEVDLSNEKINLSISTQPREGLGLNIADMINIVRLGGTIADPGIVVDTAKTGMAAARTVGAIATGGLSLLGESLMSRLVSDKAPCQTALRMK